MSHLTPPSTNEPTTRYATEDDVPTILTLIHELATYEHASSSVLATPASLLATLTFPSAPTRGFARTLLIYPPPTSASASSPPPPCAGMALFFPNYSTWRAAPGIYLEDLYVRERYRGRGYGTRLLRELARETERIGGGRLDWSVLRWNKEALGFYEGLGAGRLEEWVGMRVEGEGLRRLAGGQGRVEKVEEGAEKMEEGEGGSVR